MIYVLYNPKSNNGYGYIEAMKLKEKLTYEVSFVDVTTVDDREFYLGLNKDDEIIITGGDGTLNHFVNKIYDVQTDLRIRYFCAGCGNDFARDVKDKIVDGFIELNPYIKKLPLIKVNGRSYRFLNGIGYGLDGYCCEKGDELKAKSKKKINYSLIGLYGLFFDYERRNATVTIDGVTRTFSNVLMAPTMNGRYFGGGVMIAPNQDRLNNDEVSFVVVHNLGKLSALSIFPTLYIGKHTKFTKVVEVLKGHEITVKYDKPAPLQIDGETISNVTEYTVIS